VGDAEHRAALRRVAKLVARDEPLDDLFDSVAAEVGGLSDADLAGICRHADEHTLAMFSPWRAAGGWAEVPARLSLAGARLPRAVHATRRPAREDAWHEAAGEMAAVARDRLGIRSAVASPIVVEGAVWGALYVASTQVPHLPADTESWLETFTELVACAIANAEARARADRLANEQAALRRVAMLVAREASQADVFAAVAEEIERLTGAEEIRMLRYEDDRGAVVVACAGMHPDVFPTGSRHRLGGDNAASAVYRTGRPARFDDYARATGPIAETARRTGGLRAIAGAPIWVEGRLWGVMVTGTTGAEPLPPDVESRLGQFTELMATAIANAEARAEVRRLAEEQAALRRVATLVAQGASPTAVFDAVAAEIEALLDADEVSLGRYHRGTEVTILAQRGAGAGTQSSHKVPLIVDGALWGVLVASWRGDESPPPDTEERMAQFAALLDTAIANADTRDQLTASRARLLTEADDARRQVVRDLHDGAQQRLVQTVLTLKFARDVLHGKDEEAESLVAEALEQARLGNLELRELAHGILPPVLSHGGLGAAVAAVVARLSLPVEVDVPAERFPAPIEASAYFIVAEALTNVVKHARATRAAVRASAQDGTLRVEVRDDGIGGADADGRGLVGMSDRVTALGGSLRVQSPAGGGTLLAATLPVSARVPA
jgi:signal transduction histidine kinase